MVTVGGGDGYEKTCHETTNLVYDGGEAGPVVPKVSVALA